jgi:hypothetical protein
MLRYNLEFHSNLDGIIWVKTKKEYQECIEKLAKGGYKNLQEKVKENAKKGYWGQLDGKCSFRIYQECLKLMDRKVK